MGDSVFLKGEKSKLYCRRQWIQNTDNITTNATGPDHARDTGAAIV